MSKESRVAAVSFENNVTLTAYPSWCCEFVNWVEKDNVCNVVSKDNPWTFSVDDDKEYVAVFRKKKVRINVALDNPSLGYTLGSGVYECGDEVDISAYTACCNDIEWLFDSDLEIVADSDTDLTMNEKCVDCSEDLKSVSATIIADRDRTIVASITPNTFNVRVFCCDDDCGSAGIIVAGDGIRYGSETNKCPQNSVLPVKEGDFCCGTELLLFANTKPGCRFAGWYETDCELDNKCNGLQKLISAEPFHIVSLCRDVCYAALFEKDIRFNVTINSGECSYSADKIKFLCSVDGSEPFEYTDTFQVYGGATVSITLNYEELKCCRAYIWYINGHAIIVNQQHYTDPLVFDVNEDIVVECVFVSLCDVDYLNFKSLKEDTSIYFYPSSDDIQLSYSFDRNTWNVWDFNDPISVNQDETVYLKGNNETLYYDGNGSQFEINGSIVECHGNIMTLLDESGMLDEVPEHCFENLFMGNFSLLTAPELPAVKLNQYCYSYMFNSCSLLSEAPELPATVLANECYSAMFESCTSLVQAPELLANVLAFGCYDNMFSGCTSLEVAPELPCTTLSEFCYQGMFYYCTSLIDGPVLPAETMSNGCYNNMFNGCSNITSVYVNITSWDSNNSLNWLANVSEHGTVYKPSSTIIPSGNSGVPTGWVSEDI